MFSRNAIKFASALVLFAASACDDDKSEETGEKDAAVDSGSNPSNASDAAADAAADAAKPDASNGKPDAAVDAGDLDATVDAAVVDAGGDAQAADAANTVPDAAADAGTDAAADAGTDAATSDLEAWYKFDENTGTATTDSSGMHAAGNLINGATWAAGKLGSAVDVAGGTTNQHVALDPTLLSSCDDVTVALWMKLGTTPPWARLLDVDGLVDGFIFFTATADLGGVQNLMFDIYHPVGGGPNDQSVAAPYPANTVLVDTWHHVAFTLTGGTGRLYFDGTEIGSNPMNTKTSDVTIGTGATHAWIGRSTINTDAYLDATIDDLRVSCTAYTAQQIAALAAP